MASPGNEIPSHRACAHCRSQKVRCIASDNDPDTCQRCARSGRPCVFTPLQKRKQRKRTDTRVAELEREMRSMRAALKEKEQTTRAHSPATAETQPRGRPLGLWFKDLQPDAPRLGQTANWVQEGDDDGSVEIANRAPKSVSAPSLWPTRLPDHLQQGSRDVVDKGMVSLATARTLVETYKKDLFPHYPMVVVPDTVTADDMRREKPILFLAIIAAAAGKEHSELSAALDQEVLQAYATRSLVQSEKSLELVQALLVSAVWYHPPTKFGQLKYYEYIHMAVTMAMDIGICSRPAAHRSRLRQRNGPGPNAIHPAEDIANPDLSMAPRVRDESPDTASIESRRTLLACYTICASISLSLRRPNMLRVSSYIRECVDFLERSPHSVASDRNAIAWMRLIMIADEISPSFAYDDPGGMASITELRTQLMLKDFSNKLSAWYSSVPEADMGTGALTIMYYTIKLYLNEIALHIDHSPEDFRAPFQMGAIQVHPETEQVPTQILAESVAECISSAHALIGTFLVMDPDSLRALPVFSYVRISFAAFVLAKLCLSAAHPSSRIGKVIDRSSLKVERYMDRTILHVRSIVGNKVCRVPAIFLALLFKLRQWSLNPEMVAHPDEESEEAPEGTANMTARKHGDTRMIEDSKAAHRPGSSAESVDDASDNLFAYALSDAGISQPSSSFTPESQQADAGQYNGYEDEESQAHSINAVIAGSDSTLAPPAPAMTLNNTGMAMPVMDPYNMTSTQPMELDPSLFQYLSDMNAFAAGGLTGLDDWAVMPEMENVDMSSAYAMYGGMQAT